MLTESGILFGNFGMQISYYGPEDHPNLKESTIWQGSSLALCSAIANENGSFEESLEIGGLMTQEKVD